MSEPATDNQPSVIEASVKNVNTAVDPIRQKIKELNSLIADAASLGIGIELHTMAETRMRRASYDIIMIDRVVVGRR